MGRKMASAALPPSDLYERDYYTWILEQVRALRERRVEDLDWPNLAEEIEDLGKSERRGLRSQITRLLVHLLKLAFARPRLLEPNRRGWELRVRGGSRKLLGRPSENPRLPPPRHTIYPSA